MPCPLFPPQALLGGGAGEKPLFSFQERAWQQGRDKATNQNIPGLKLISATNPQIGDSTLGTGASASAARQTTLHTCRASIQPQGLEKEQRGSAAPRLQNGPSAFSLSASAVSSSEGVTGSEFALLCSGSGS